jgi:UDP-N-acetylglucosamine acyltransferase
MTDIHSTAIIDKNSQLGEDVKIGPYCVVGPNVSIHDGTRLMSHVVLDGHTTLGRNCEVFPFASIGTQTQDLKFKGETTYVKIGDNTTLREYVTVNSSTNEGEVTRIGSGCHIMAYSHVAHACEVGNNVIMANCATLAGHIIVQDQAIIGGLTAVHQFVRIGRLCMIGGCSRVSQDCPPFMTIAGNPARARGLNSTGLQRKNVDDDARKKLKDAYKVIYRQNLSTSQAVEKINAEIEMCPELETLIGFIKNSERGIIK